MPLDAVVEAVAAAGELGVEEEGETWVGGQREEVWVEEGKEEEEREEEEGEQEEEERGRENDEDVFTRVWRQRRTKLKSLIWEYQRLLALTPERNTARMLHMVVCVSVCLSVCARARACMCACAHRKTIRNIQKLYKRERRQQTCIMS